ncbi:MAG: AsmA family protein [Burkholderiaceae bacterium]|nr:AsmA family protein [Burkholderiaceae bacterium]
MIKKLLLGLVALVVIVVVAAVALLLFVDVDRFKPQIESFVSSHYGRTLKIDGRLSLSVFPNIAVALPKSSISGRDGQGEFASLGGARVSVALMPLLRGEVRADTIRIDRLRARLERDAKGRLSIDDLVGADKASAAKPAPAEKGATGGSAPLALAIGGIELNDAEIVFDDRQAGNRITVSGLDLKTGAIGNGRRTPLTLGARFASTRPAGNGELSLKAELALDPAAKRIALYGLDARVGTTLDATAIEVKLGAPALSVTGDALGADEIRIDATLAQAARRVVAALNTSLKGRLDNGVFELPALRSEVTIEDPALPAKSMKISSEGSARIDTRAQVVNARTTARIGDATLKSQVDVKGFAQPAIRFTLDADRLDLDALMPVAAGAGAPAQPKDAKAASAPADTPIDLSPLKTLNLDGKARIGELKVQGMHASKIDATIRASGGRLDIAPLSAELYGGQLAAKANAQAGGNRLGLDARLTQVRIGPLVKDATGKDIVEGSGNVQIDVNTGGPSVAALKKALAGKAAVQLRDGAIKGINLGESLRKAKSALAGGKAESQAADTAQKTDFTAMSVSFAISNGVARSDDLDARSPLLRIGGGGQVDLAASTLDYTVRASVVGTSTGQGGRDLAELNGVTIPVRLSGPFAAPTWRIDWQSAAREALKSKAGEKLKEKLEPEKEKLKARRDELRDKLKGKLGDQLKGLFK